MREAKEEIIKQIDDTIKKHPDLLTPRFRRVLEMRFKEGKTLEEVGMEFCVTRERIRQMQAKALEKIRRAKELN